MEAQAGGAERIARLIERFGCLPVAPDGPALPGFSPHPLADAIMQEVKRAGEYGWSKITIHMDIPDAVALAVVLKNAR
jgi:hypothetical protein